MTRPAPGHAPAPWPGLGTEPFGTHPLPPPWRGLVALAQRLPRNWFSQQFAQIVRRLVLRRVHGPVDLTVGPVRMRCRLVDNNAERQFVFMPWRFDRRELAALRAALPRDGVFVDIGANVGTYTLQAACQLGARGRVIAFEPHPHTHARLCFNLDATRAGREPWPDVQALPIGIGDRAGELELNLDRDNLGACSLLCDRPGTAAGSIRVQVQPLADALAALDVTHIDVLKIDIEGAEDLALGPWLDVAAERALPGLMIIENSQHRWQLDLPALLRRRGYTPCVRTRLNTVWRRQAPA